MYHKLPLLQNEDPSAGGGGAAPAPAPAPGPAPAPAPSEPTLNIAEAAASIGADLFPKETSREDPANAGRDASGRFTPAPGTSPAPAPAAPAPSPAAATAGAPAPGASPAPAPSSAPASSGSADLSKAPDSWKPDVAAATWATLPDAVKSEIHRRESDMFRGLSEYKNDAVIGRTTKSIVAPLLPHLQAAGVQPDAFLRGLTQVHLNLSDMSQPEQKRVEFLFNTAKQYGIDLSKYDFGGAPGSTTNIAGQSAEAESLRAEIRGLQSRLNERDQREVQGATAAKAAEVNAFAADPKNVHFNEVADDMVILIKGSGGTMSLQDAYERACRANPAVSAKLTADLEAKTAARVRQELTEAAAKAKKATEGNVRSGGHSGSRAAETGSMDDTMAATLRDIRARDKVA